MTTLNSAIEIFNQGGFMMWPLLLLSITALAIIIERAMVLRASSVVPVRALFEDLRAIRAGTFDEELVYGTLQKGVAGRLLYTFITSPISRTQAEGHALLEGQVLQIRLERHTHLLGTIAIVAPLIGLLGTIIGMMQIFHALLEANGRSADLAGGLSIALITTAFGLGIAIPATFLHRHFTKKAEVIISEFYRSAQMMLDTLYPSGEAKLFTMDTKEAAMRSLSQGQ